MTYDAMLRPLAFSSCAALGMAALLPGAAPALAQQYGAPSRYGQPYDYGPPAGTGQRRALDNTYRRPPAPVPAHRPYGRPGIWQGLYVGGHGGWLGGDATATGGSQSVDLSGGALGLHVGYNWQGGNWVIGLEGDGTWANASGSRSFAGPTFVDAHADWTSSLRMRAGYSISNVLVYATGGAAFGGFDLGVGSTGVSSRYSDSVFGYVAGAGVEMKFTPNMSGRIEALYYGFDEKSFKFSSGTVPVDLGVTTVRAGLTYHFN